jgi:hypothetical protein
MASVRLCLVLLMIVVGFADVGADTYPKNRGVDVVHYRFALDLTDQDDRVSGTADVDVRFAGEGAAMLRFDLINLDQATGRGMTVSRGSPRARSTASSPTRSTGSGRGKKSSACARSASGA